MHAYLLYSWQQVKKPSQENSSTQTHTIKKYIEFAHTVYIFRKIKIKNKKITFSLRVQIINFFKWTNGLCKIFKIGFHLNLISLFTCICFNK